MRILCRHDRVRLRSAELDEYERVALAWYQDPEVLRFSEGGEPPYDLARLRRMFEVMSAKGELYFIDERVGGAWRPVGDVGLLPDDVPIVIGRPEDRSRGIGSETLELIAMRARELGWTELRTGPIDPANIRSRRLFQRAGFVEQPADASAGDAHVRMIRVLERAPG
jgi:RimJ/RimL family protein N-acetyltransferase